MENKNEEVIEVTEVQEVKQELVETTTCQNNLLDELEKIETFAEKYSKSTIIPMIYQRNKENTMVALDMAVRMNVSPMMVMQNLYVVNGKPSWSGQAICSMVRNSSQFKDVELVYVGEEGTDSYGAYVTATSTKTGRKLKGSTVTIGIAKAEGWFQKAGSKWKTMPEQMLGYRAYAWFGRLHCPELLMGLQSNDEVEDITNPQPRKEENPYERK